MQTILGLDQGTSSSRAVLLQPDGILSHVAQRQLPQIFPEPGWVEQDPEAIWSSQAAAIRAVLDEASLSAGDIKAIGITNQRETTIVWNRQTGRPIANAIVWQDRRTAAYCSRLSAEGLEDTVRAKTGLVLDAYFSASKVRWILDHVPGARDQARAGKLAFGTVDSWLIWKLTAGRRHVIDVTNASRTLLFNIHTLAWDDDLLAIFDIPKSILPEVVDSSGICAETVELIPHVRIAGIAGDQQAALFGQMCTQPGMAKNTYGTGCFLLMNTGAQAVASSHRLLTTVAWRFGGRTEYALEGSIFIAGAAIQWLRDGLGILHDSAEVEALAESVPDSGGVVFVPALTGLGAPHWDAQARGTILGLTRGTTRAHLARATLEGIALEVTDVLHAMESDAGLQIQQLRVDGGASVNNLLMQMQADLLGVPVVRAQTAETTVLGACYLAGLATGVWSGMEEIASNWRESARFTPALSEADRQSRLGQWQRALERARAWEQPA